MLLAAGADLLHRNNEGATAYHVSVWECRAEMQQWLREQYLARGAALPDVGENPDGDEEGEGDGAGEVGGAEGEGEWAGEGGDAEVELESDDGEAKR